MYRLTLKATPTSLKWWLFQSFNTQICLLILCTYSCSKLHVGLRGGYFRLEVIISTHHHRPVWAHP